MDWHIFLLRFWDFETDAVKLSIPLQSFYRSGLIFFTRTLSFPLLFPTMPFFLYKGNEKRNSWVVVFNSSETLTCPQVFLTLFLIFSMNFFGSSEILFIFATDKVCSREDKDESLHWGNPEANDAVCRADWRERRLRTLSFCVVKLRNFDSTHRDNATISVCVGELYPSCSYVK